MPDCWIGKSLSTTWKIVIRPKVGILTCPSVYVTPSVIPLSFDISSPRISKSGGRHPFFMTFLLAPVSNSMVNFSFKLSNSEIVGQELPVICPEEYISNSFGFFFPRYPLTCKSGWFLELPGHPSPAGHGRFPGLERRDHIWKIV